MQKELPCPNCDMSFNDEKRLIRHVKKTHPPKRKIDPNPSADFNHAFFPL